MIALVGLMDGSERIRSAQEWLPEAEFPARVADDLVFVAGSPTEAQMRAGLGKILYLDFNQVKGKWVATERSNRASLVGEARLARILESKFEKYLEEAPPTVFELKPAVLKAAFDWSAPLGKPVHYSEPALPYTKRLSSEVVDALVARAASDGQRATGLAVAVRSSKRDLSFYNIKLKGDGQVFSWVMSHYLYVAPAGPPPPSSVVGSAEVIPPILPKDWLTWAEREEDWRKNVVGRYLDQVSWGEQPIFLQVSDDLVATTLKSKATTSAKWLAEATAAGYVIESSGEFLTGVDPCSWESLSPGSALTLLKDRNEVERVSCTVAGKEPEVARESALYAFLTEELPQQLKVRSLPFALPVPWRILLGSLDKAAWENGLEGGRLQITANETARFFDYTSHEGFTTVRGMYEQPIAVWLRYKGRSPGTSTLRIDLKTEYVAWLSKEAGRLRTLWELNGGHRKSDEPTLDQVLGTCDLGQRQSLTVALTYPDGATNSLVVPWGEEKRVAKYVRFSQWPAEAKKQFREAKQ